MADRQTLEGIVVAILRPPAGPAIAVLQVKIGVYIALQTDVQVEVVGRRTERVAPLQEYPGAGSRHDGQRGVSGGELVVAVGAVIIGTYIMVTRGVAGGRKEDGAVVGGLLGGLGNRTVCKHWLAEEAQIIDDDVDAGASKCLVSQEFDGFDHLQAGAGAGECQAGVRRQVVDDFQERGAFVAFPGQVGVNLKLRRQVASGLSRGTGVHAV